MKSRRLRFSVHTKIFVASFAACALIAVSITGYFARQGFAAADQALESKAATYARVLAREAESAVAFEDHVTASEAFDAMTADPDVSGLAIYLDDGSLLEARGDVATSDATHARRIVRRAPVVSREGPRGSAVVQMSTASLDKQRAALVRTALVAAGTTLLCSFLAAWAIARSIARRLAELAKKAGRVAAGDVTGQTFAATGNDEIGDLEAAFRSMVGDLSRLMAERELRAADEQRRLELLVAARTTALDERTRGMRMLLDNVSDGFVVVGTDGKLGSDRSASFDRWFSVRGGDAHIVPVIATADPKVAAWFEMAWADMVAGTLPLEVAAAQFPQALSRDGRTYSLTVTPIADEAGAMTHALLILHDATEKLELARAELAQREVLGLLEVALADRSTFLQFLAEGDAIIERLRSDTFAGAVMERDVHTLKGNSGLFGLASVATACHALEDQFAENDGHAMRASRNELIGRWEAATGQLSTVFAKSAAGRLDIERAAFERLIGAIDARTTHAELAHAARILRLEPVTARLEHLAGQGAALADRLEKRVDIVAIGDDSHFEHATWGPFWSSLAHALRNAIYHGTEGPDERARAGKSAVGRIELAAHADGPSFVVDVRDDGRGIDWPALAAKASALGLASSSEKDLLEALFADGVSSATEISDIAGRGVGMAALRAACIELGGECRVMSTRGQGTTMRFVFPLSSLGDTYRDRTQLFPLRTVA